MPLSKLPSFFHSLRTRFIVVVGLTTALCLGASTFITLKLHYQQLIGAKREKAAVLQEAITQLFARAPLTVGHKEMQAIFQAMSRHSDIRIVRLIGGDDLILKSSRPDEIGIKFILEPPPTRGFGKSTIFNVVDEGIIQHGQRLEGGKIVRKIMAIAQRPRDERWAFLPQVFSGRTHKHARTLSAIASIYDQARCGQCHQQPVPALLNIGLSLKETNLSLQAVGTRLLAWALVTTVLVGVVISLLFSKLVNTPLAQLIGTFRAVEKGDLRARATITHRDEIGLLGDQFNTMVERLGMAQEKIQRYHEEQMEEASRMASVGEMASALAHEIRNPLAAISGAAQVLREDIDPAEPRHRVLTEIMEQVDRLARVVSNILRFTKLQPLQLEQALLPKVLSEALAVFEAQLQEGQIQVIREEQPGLRPIKVDPSQMQQVFMNLILNARKAMPEGGELKIRIYSTKEHDKDTQVVEFQDTGPELSPERLEEIFKPFYTKKSGDTGLGLSVAQKIVSSHGGKLAAHGQLERGTVFSVTLPEEGPTKAPDASATSVSHPLEVG